MHNNELFSRETNLTKKSIEDFFAQIPETGCTLKGAGANISEIDVRQFTRDPLLLKALDCPKSEITLSEIQKQGERWFAISIPKKIKDIEEWKEIASSAKWEIDERGENFIIFEQNGYSFDKDNPTLH